MSEKYQKFDASDYVKTDADVRELLRAAMDEDPGDGTVIRSVLKDSRQNTQHKCSRPRHRAKPKQPLRRAVGRRQPHSRNPAENNPRTRTQAEP